MPSPNQAWSSQGYVHVTLLEELESHQLPIWRKREVVRLSAVHVSQTIALWDFVLKRLHA